MRLLLIRHAIAVPRGTPGIPDDERSLTPEGEARFREAARGLARIADRPDVLLSSPLPRALKTAQIAAETWGEIEPEIERSLAGGSFEEVAAAIGKLPPDSTVAVVGHEPHLSRLLARLLTTREETRLALRKGGAALVEIETLPSRGGTLIWFIPPKVLRRLGEGRR